MCDKTFVTMTTMMIMVMKIMVMVIMVIVILNLNAPLHPIQVCEETFVKHCTISINQVEDYMACFKGCE